jgi:predicted ester cyclase
LRSRLPRTILIGDQLHRSGKYNLEIVNLDRAPNVKHQRELSPVDRRALPFAVDRSRRIGSGSRRRKMVEQINRKRVIALLEQFASGDIEGSLARCTDDVDFLTHAPVDLLPHVGHHRGKAELGKMWQIVHERYYDIHYEMPIMIAEGAQVATYLRAFFRKRSNDRIVQFDIAVFYTFRDGLVAQIRELIDTFDLVQQVLERDVAAMLAADKTEQV